MSEERRCCQCGLLLQGKLAAGLIGNLGWFCRPCLDHHNSIGRPDAEKLFRSIPVDPNHELQKIKIPFRPEPEPDKAAFDEKVFNRGVVHGIRQFQAEFTALKTKCDRYERALEEVKDKTESRAIFTRDALNLIATDALNGKDSR